MPILKFGEGNTAPESRVSTGLKWVAIGSGIAFATLCVRDYARCQNQKGSEPVTPEEIDAAADLPNRLLADED